MYNNDITDNRSVQFSSVSVQCSSDGFFLEGWLLAQFLSHWLRAFWMSRVFTAAPLLSRSMHQCAFGARWLGDHTVRPTLHLLWSLFIYICECVCVCLRAKLFIIVNWLIYSAAMRCVSQSFKSDASPSTTSFIERVFANIVAPTQPGSLRNWHIIDSEYRLRKLPDLGGKSSPWRWCDLASECLPTE